MAALHDGNPAVVEMMLRHQREHGGGLAFARSFRSWILNVAGHDDGEGSPRCLPLHASCHAGSPEVLSVLLKFIFDSYSVEDQAAMVNARDCNHRSALHLASWSPRPQCPGRRNAMIRNLLAHDADVHLKDTNGRTALHQACQAGDCLSVEGASGKLLKQKTTNQEREARSGLKDSPANGGIDRRESCHFPQISEG
eukprot:jgi/Undpi1/6139/HiC_scaffold_20.g08624.m1